MSVSFKNDNVEISAIRDRAMFHTFAGNQSFVIKGIGDELALTYSASSFVVSIGTGEAVICGGSTLVEGTNEITLNQNESGYIVIRVDLAQTGDNICQFKAVPSLVQENINDEGYIYDFPLARYTTNGSGVNSFTDQRVVRNNITDNVVKTIDGRTPTNNNINLTDVVKTINGVAPTNNNINIDTDYIKTINEKLPNSSKDFSIGEGSNISFYDTGFPPNTYYTLGSLNKAYVLASSSLLSNIKQDVINRSSRSYHYNTYIKTSTSSISDFPTKHLTDKASIYVSRNNCDNNSSELNATCLWVSLESEGVVFKRNIVNGAWSGGWKFVGGRDLLWTNTNPNQDFQRATINLTNLSEYEKLLIEFRGHKSEKFINSAIIPISPIVSNNISLLQTFRMGSSVFSVYGRQVRVEGNIVNFDLGNAYQQESPNFTRIDDNQLIIPINIYGC